MKKTISLEIPIKEKSFTGIFLKWLKFLAPQITHFFTLAILFSFGQLILQNGVDISAQKLVHYDAGFYADISCCHYKYLPGQASNMAFFPLFPMLWRLLEVSPEGMATINLLLFYISVALLRKSFSLNFWKTLFLLSIPSCIFNMIPYSESLFYFFGTLLILGLKHNKNLLIFLGILGAGLAKTSGMFFLATGLFLLFTQIKKQDKRDAIIKFSIILAAQLLSFFTGAFIQYSETGVAFEFLHQQQHWGHGWHWPEIPMISIEDMKMIWLDAMAHFITFLCALLSLSVLRKKVLNLNWKPSAERIFATAYLAIYFPFMLLYFDTGNLWSVNRFVFASPFFALLVIYYFKKNWLNRSGQGFLLFIAALLLWNLYGVYFGAPELSNIQNYQQVLWIMFIGVMLYFVAFHKSRKISHYLPWIVGTNLIFQYVLFARFLTMQWVG
jgi:hypothetical protein